MRFYSEEQKERFQLEFVHRQRRQATAFLCACSLAVLPNILFMTYLFPLPSQSYRVFMVAMFLIILFIYGVFSFVNWRCPGCHAFLGRQLFFLSNCPTCQLSLASPANAASPSSLGPLISLSVLVIFLGVISVSMGQLGITQKLAAKYGDLFYFSKYSQMSGSPEEMVNKGWELENQGRNIDALVLYNKALRIDPDNALAHKHRGMYFASKMGNYKEAMLEFSKAIELDPTNASFFYNRGFAYQTQEDYQEALSDYTEALRLDPNYYSAISNRGTVYLILKNYALAIEDFSKSLTANPNAAQVYMYRGLAYYALGNKSYAQEDFDSAIRLNPALSDEIASRKSSIK